MRRCGFAFAILPLFLPLLAAPQAHAMVGLSDEGGPAARHTVMVLKQGSRSASFCSGAVLARKVVLTAAHCVHGAKSVAIYVPAGGAPKLYEAHSITIHPGFVAGAIAKRRRSIDLALVRIREPLPGHLQGIALASDSDFAPGSPFRIAGFGLRREGVEASAGSLRSARMRVREPLSSILLWMNGAAAGIGGACTGDSGGPIFNDDFSELAGIIVWARGVGKRRCGELTQGVKLAPQRNWIIGVLRKWAAR